MAHELELDRQGRASFCYSHRNGNPWHRLGVPMDGCFTLADAVRAARIRTAVAAPLTTMTAQGFIDVTSHKAVVWPALDDDGDVDLEAMPVVLGVVGKDYPIIQYYDVIELALAVVGAAPDDAVLDTVGLIFDGKRMFGFIDFGDVDVALPSGRIDKLFKGLGFMSSMDGSQAITFWKTHVRAVCNNTVQFGISSSPSVARVRHVGDAAERMREVPQLLDLAFGGDPEFAMLVAEMDTRPGGHDVLDRVIRKVWPEPAPDESTTRGKAIWFNRRDRLHDLYTQPSNQGFSGDTGWAVYNTIGEFLDHSRGKDADRRARNSIDVTSSVSTTKQKVAELVLGR